MTSDEVVSGLRPATNASYIEDHEVASLYDDGLRLCFDPDDLQLATCPPLDDSLQQAGMPTFGNVAVSNSSDVHFGNKTYYQGPVTIEKVVYSGTGPPDPHEDVIPDGQVAKPCSKLAIVRQRVCKNKAMLVGAAMLVVLMITILLALTLYLNGRGVDVNTADPPDDRTPPDELDYRVVSRVEWVAQPAAKAARPLAHPAPVVVVSQTDTEACATVGDCVFVVRFLQTYYIEGRNISDIAFNFLVGGDGNVYEGRGWDAQGEHTVRLNARSVGVAFIGAFQQEAPTARQTAVFRRLIAHGVAAKLLAPDYKLIGLRQVEANDNPGDKLFELMQTWPHWAEAV